MIKHLNEIKALNLPDGKFAIFGSGPLAVRGIRQNYDLDILVMPEVWKDLKGHYHVTSRLNKPDSLYVGHLQIMSINYRDWKPFLDDPAVMITDCEYFEGLPFVKLQYLIGCKMMMEDKKHADDIDLIKEYLLKTAQKNSKAVLVRTNQS